MLTTHPQNISPSTRPMAESRTRSASPGPAETAASCRGGAVHAVIVGAGPYGLSLAAHLREAGVSFRIFGRPMQTWMTQMPAGMRLKSDGFASNLSAGSRPYTLEDFCRETGREYHPTLVPIPVEDFAAYGQEFARRFVPNLEPCDVAQVEQAGGLFRIVLETGETLTAANVILATGLSLFQHIPSTLARLPRDIVSHTADHRFFDQFAGREVAVVGRGASSLNAAALLHEAGAKVSLLSRGGKIHIHVPAEEQQERRLLERVRHPSSPLGYSMRSWLSCRAPGVFRALPSPVRRLLVYKHLGPSGGSFLHGRVHGKVELLLGWSILSARLLDAADGEDRRILLCLRNARGETMERTASHVVAGTGFRIDLSRIRFVDPAMRERLRADRSGAPELNRYFESSVKGLYFIGPSGSGSFGPLLRFAAGSQYAAERVCGKLRRLQERPA